MMLTHPARQKSAPKPTPMIVSTPIPGLIEITTESDTVFRTMDPTIAKLFLNSLGKIEVRMFSTTTSVQTGADIALLILDRETA